MQFIRSFVKQKRQYAKNWGIRALLVAPYGEALVHPWYWEGLALASSLDGMDAVGAQTNLGFAVKQMAGRFADAGGVFEKLKLVAAFHPQMATVQEFSQRVRQLQELGVTVSAGAVGAPENIGLVRQLQKALPEGVHLWINKMDGLRRAYTEDEKKAFAEIDPYVFREWMPPAADVSKCQGRIFVEADGRLRTCPLGPVLGQGWQDICRESQNRRPPGVPQPVCRRSVCTCHLAYSGRDDFMNQVLFGPYPLFRIPRKPRAAFFDIAGTLVPKPGSGKAGKVPVPVLEGLNVLSLEKTALFFATTMPYPTAMACCASVRKMFRGGVFAAGAHLVFNYPDGSRKEHYYYLDESCRQYLEGVKGVYRFRILDYQHGGRSYKLTLLRTSKRPWSLQEAHTVFQSLPVSCQGHLRYFVEGNCMQIVAAQADKAAGVKMLCSWLGVPLAEAVAAGDSAEDAGMLALCGVS